MTLRKNAFPLKRYVGKMSHEGDGDCNRSKDGVIIVSSWIFEFAGYGLG